MREYILKEAMDLHCSWKRKGVRISHLTCGHRLQMTKEELDLIDEFFKSKPYDEVVSCYGVYSSDAPEKVWAVFKAWKMEKRLSSILEKGIPAVKVRL